MRIPCPNCAAEYDVPASRLPARRVVRCSRCGNQWTFVQEAEAPLADSGDAFGSLSDLPPAPEISAADRLGAASSHAPRDMRLVAAWVASFLLIAGGVSAAIAYRADLVRTWPPSGRLFGVPQVPLAAPVAAPSAAPVHKAEK